MDYQKVNEYHKRKINEITNNNIEMEWNNPELLEILIGKLPKLVSYDFRKDGYKEFLNLKKIYDSYNSFETDKEKFLIQIKELENVIFSKNELWSGINTYYLEDVVRMHEFCVIKGPGGIGKSYFIKCLEDELSKVQISHLCIYGKFLSDLSFIDFNELSKIVENKKFIFIVDAINEIKKDIQIKLLDEILKLIPNKNIRIIITYRNNALTNDVIEKLNTMLKYQLNFQGVSYESALMELLKKPVPDIYKYENILFSNNPLLLNMLCDLLNSSKITENQNNNITSITYIYEHFIKDGIDKVFKKNNLSSSGLDIWNDTKKIAEWMYQNNTKKIDINNLKLNISRYIEYINVMSQIKMIDKIQSNGIDYYYFTIDSLSDFLIARSAFKDLKDNSKEDQIKIITSKLKKIPSLKEALILTIFDKYGSQYEIIYEILKGTKLIEDFDYETLLKINFDKESIPNFLKYFKFKNEEELFDIFGGYTDKPFNCVNYFNDYYSDEKKQTIELSKHLSGKYLLDNIIGRLKNLLYFITINKSETKRLEEAYYFSIWCCAASNKDVRMLATKLLYEIVLYNKDYKSKLIIDYYKFKDYYIIESIIFVLSYYLSNDDEVTEFMKQLKINEERLSAKSVRRIASYLNEDYEYIYWNRKNIFYENENYDIPEELNSLLMTIDVIDKTFLPFRYLGKENINLYNKFLKENKETIRHINNILKEEFNCVKNGKCNGSLNFYDIAKQKLGLSYNIDILDINSFLYSFEKVIKEIFKYYDESLDENIVFGHTGEFGNSLFSKCLDISKGLLYGSLMCNYYLNDFGTYNNKQDSIGYEVYDPLEYGEEINIIAPIPTYQYKIEKLDDLLVNNVEIPSAKDAMWLGNVELTRKNIITLLKPIVLDNEEWLILGGAISIKESDAHGILWEDTYLLWCCTSDNETIKKDGDARYLTIELDEYTKCIEQYYMCNQKQWLCKDITTISHNSDILDNTTMSIPPASIISKLNLKYNNSDATWINSNDESIIICNNNKNSYYIEPTSFTIFIRKDYFDKFIADSELKYFGFAERYIKSIGRVRETSIHFEIKNNQIVKEVLNDDYSESEQEVPFKCKNCKWSAHEKKKQNDLFDECKKLLVKCEYLSDEED